MNKLKEIPEYVTLIATILILCTIAGYSQYSHLNQIVDVTICSKDGMTSYVSRNKPSSLLNFGECTTIQLKKTECFGLRHNMNASKH